MQMAVTLGAVHTHTHTHITLLKKIKDIDKVK